MRSLGIIAAAATDFGHLLLGLMPAIVMPLASAVSVALICGWMGLSGKSALFWIACSPLLYFAWLVLLLGFWALETTLIGFYFVRPRRYWQKEKPITSLGFLTVICLYMQGFIVRSLPLASYLVGLPWFGKLALRAYSPKIHIGANTWITGLITDPDITFIGPDVVIGYDCRIIAHSLARTPEGHVIYQSAPIELGARCTIGGASQIELGASVGVDAVVEPYSRVAPFTRIPPGQIWGGNPAVFKGERNGDGRARNLECKAQSDEIGSRRSEHGGTRSEVQALIAHALSLPPEAISRETSSATCAAWDSLGKLAIAAALYDRFGIQLSPENAFALDSVAEVEQARARKTAPGFSSSQPELPSDPELLPLLAPGAATAALLGQAKGEAPIKTQIVVAATFTAQPLASSLQLFSRAFGIETELEFFDFNQVHQALLSPESLFRRNREGVNVALVRLEDLPGDKKAAAERLLSAIRTFLHETGGALVVGDLPPALHGSSRPDDDPSGMNSALLRSWWRQQLSDVRGAQILPFAAIIEEIGTAAAQDRAMELEAGVPFSPQVYQRLGIAIARILRKTYLPAKKVIALDCDGTLWGGVLGEDGPDAIQSTEPFKAFQREVLALQRRGVLLALVSKNVPEDVWGLLDSNTDLALRRHDFSAAKINWKPKSENLRELANELGLGLDSFVFLDDSPAEQLEVKANCPGVTVVPFSTDASHNLELLSRLWCFDGAGATAEDARRSDYTRQEQERADVAKSAVSLESYLESLEVKVEIRRAQDGDLERVAQLTQKTNQFNLSLKRRSLQEIRALGDSAEVWVLSACDKFGDYGLVGVGILRRTEKPLTQNSASCALDTFLLSCRALGRGIEERFLRALSERAAAAGAKTLLAQFVAGPRNQPMKFFLEKSGFKNAGDGCYLADLEGSATTLKASRPLTLVATARNYGRASRSLLKR